jgi:hypothetical protein
MSPGQPYFLKLAAFEPIKKELVPISLLHLIIKT